MSWWNDIASTVKNTAAELLEATDNTVSEGLAGGKIDSAAVRAGDPVDVKEMQQSLQRERETSNMLGE
jgi:hypothetical protein